MAIVIDILNKYVEDGKLKTQANIGKFSFQQIEDAILSKGPKAYEELGYKHKAGFTTLLDRNIDITRKRGEDWSDILQDIDTEFVSYHGLGINDIPEQCYYIEDNIKKEHRFFSTYKRMLNKANNQDYIVDKSWDTLSGFKKWFDEHYIEGSRMMTRGAVYSPETSKFFEKRT